MDKVIDATSTGASSRGPHSYRKISNGIPLLIPELPSSARRVNHEDIGAADAAVVGHAGRLDIA